MTRLGREAPTHPPTVLLLALLLTLLPTVCKAAQRGEVLPDATVLHTDYDGAEHSDLRHHGLSERLRELSYDGAGRVVHESVVDTWSGQTLERTWSGYEGHDQRR